MLISDHLVTGTFRQENLRFFFLRFTQLNEVYSVPKNFEEQLSKILDIKSHKVIIRNMKNLI